MKRRGGGGGGGRGGGEGNRWWPPQDPKVVTRENYLGGKGAAPQSAGNGDALIIYCPFKCYLM